MSSSSRSTTGSARSGSCTFPICSAPSSRLRATAGFSTSRRARMGARLHRGFRRRSRPRHDLRRVGRRRERRHVARAARRRGIVLAARSRRAARRAGSRRRRRATEIAAGIVERLGVRPGDTEALLAASTDAVLDAIPRLARRRGQRLAVPAGRRRRCRCPRPRSTRSRPATPRACAS